MKFKESGWFSYYCGIRKFVWGRETVWDVYYYGDIGIEIDDFSASNMSNLYYFSKTRK